MVKTPHELTQEALEALPKPTTKEAVLEAVSAVLDPARTQQFEAWLNKYSDALLRRINV